MLSTWEIPINLHPDAFKEGYEQRQLVRNAEQFETQFGWSSALARFWNTFYGLFQQTLFLTRGSEKS